MPSSLMQILPSPCETTPESIADAVLKIGVAPIGVASPEAIGFCAELAQRLLSDPRARRHPALQALGFWLRPGSIKNMIQSHLTAPSMAVRVPRGVVFQIPPSNVDVLFGYMSALSLLAGNITVLRLPSGHRPEQTTLLTILGEVLDTAPISIRQRLMVLRYDHDDEVTAALSALCDARMVWGGDETVAVIRDIPLPPLALEASFADRFSSMALNAAHYVTLGETQKDQMISAIYNDIYLFDQMTCASPRLLLWVGDQAAMDQATDDFYPRLAAYAMEQYGAPAAGENLAKLNAQFLALHDLDVTQSKTFNPALTVVTLASWKNVSAFKSINFGFGLLLEKRIDRLRDLAPYVEKRDQTLTVWGFSPDEVQAFVSLCGGRGFDRIIPIGQALSFEPIWDGHNLFDTLTRQVQVSV